MLSDNSYARYISLYFQKLPARPQAYRRQQSPIWTYPADSSDYKDPDFYHWSLSEEVLLKPLCIRVSQIIYECLQYEICKWLIAEIDRHKEAYAQKKRLTNQYYVLYLEVNLYNKKYTNEY
jgi:hypothetical protein